LCKRMPMSRDISRAHDRQFAWFDQLLHSPLNPEKFTLATPPNAPARLLSAFPQSRARKAVELEAAHIPNRGVAPTVPLFCRFPVPSTEVNPGYESGSSGSTRSPKASKKIGRGSAPGAGANAAICPGSSFNHRAPASVHRSLRPVNRSDVRRFSSSAAVSGKRTAPFERPVGRLSITLNFQPTIFGSCFKASALNEILAFESSSCLAWSITRDFK
jgi:hypothetical protein